MNVKIRHKFIEIEYYVSNWFVIPHYMRIRILEAGIEDVTVYP